VDANDRRNVLTRRAALGAGALGVAAIAADRVILHSESSADRALANALDAASGSLTLAPPGDRGSFQIGIDGVDGYGSFAGPTNPEPYQRLRLSSPIDPRGDAPGHTPGGPLHLFVGPYSHGMAIECKGVVECWVEDWSIHNNNRGEKDVSGDEARLWVGNNIDTGGLFMSAHTSEPDDPRKRWCRIVSRNFDGDQGNGPIQFVVRDPSDHFSFGAGDTGSRPGTVGSPRESARITSDGSLRLGSPGEPRDRLHITASDGAAIRLQDTGAGGASRFLQTGEVLSISTYDSAGVPTATPITIDASGVGFNNAPPSRPALGAPAIDSATSRALVNEIRSALIAIGLMR
jgi:hypothetical protein